MLPFVLALSLSAALAASPQAKPRGLPFKPVTGAFFALSVPNMAEIAHGMVNTELWSELPPEQWLESEYALARTAGLPLIVSLGYTAAEITELAPQIAPFADAGAQVFTFHPEATTHVQRQLATVRERGMRAGLALNPASPLSLVEEVLDELDLLLIMSVNPGFGGQAYWPGATDKLRRARMLLDARGSQAALEVDGGITRETIAGVCAAGADTLVVGAAIFCTDDPGGALRELRRACYPEA